MRSLRCTVVLFAFAAAALAQTPKPTPTPPAPPFAGKRPSMKEAAERFAAHGVQPGQPLPALDLVDLDGKAVDVQALRAGRPAILVTCSLTCNVARRQRDALAELRARAGDRAFLALVYTIDAHPAGDPCPYTGEEWVPPGNGDDDALVRQPTTLAERLALAKRYADRWAGGVPVLVDGMANASWRALGEAPNTGLCTDRDGVVVARTGWFDAAAMLAALPAASALFERLRTEAASGPLVVAHRGASEDFPENTLRALREAVAAKAHVVEFDVWQTRDGAWVLLHDATLDRTTDAATRFDAKQVRVDERTLDEVRTLDAGAWKEPRFAGERVPTLEEALAAVRPAVAMVERKGGDAQALVAELRRLRAIDDVIVQAFDWPWLEQVHRAEPRLLLAALGDKEPTAERLAAVAATGARIVHWNHRTLDADTAASVRAGGRMLCTYTVDPDVLLLGAVAIGCELVTTNRPARLVALRQRGLPALRAR
jgi:glycerophosphoryl diester phosphodiesterase